MKYFRISGLVLEVGSGHRPYPQSDVLVDKFLDESQRGGQLQTHGRPLIVSDIEKMPFREKAFAYSIASHVVEHVEHPERALRELMRVSSAGYIETPSALMEFVEPHRDYHLWFVKNEQGTLVFIPKKTRSGFKQRVSYRLLEDNFSFRLFYHSNPQLIKTVLEWKETIPFRIEKRPFHPDEYLLFVKQGIWQFVRNLLGKVWEELVKKYVHWQRKRHPRPVELEKILICPRCGGELSIQKHRIVCTSCQGFYPRNENVYFLSREYFKKGL